MIDPIEGVISKWLKCDITGDAAMSQIVNILDEERRNENEVNNACTKE